MPRLDTFSNPGTFLFTDQPSLIAGDTTRFNRASRIEQLEKSAARVRILRPLALALWAQRGERHRLMRRSCTRFEGSGHTAARF